MTLVAVHVQIKVGLKMAIFKVIHFLIKHFVQHYRLLFPMTLSECKITTHKYSIHQNRFRNQTKLVSHINLKFKEKLPRQIYLIMLIFSDFLKNIDNVGMFYRF